MSLKDERPDLHGYYNVPSTQSGILTPYYLPRLPLSVFCIYCKEYKSVKYIINAPRERWCILDFLQICIPEPYVACSSCEYKSVALNFYVCRCGETLTNLYDFCLYCGYNSKHLYLRMAPVPDVDQSIDIDKRIAWKRECRENERRRKDMENMKRKKPRQQIVLYKPLESEEENLENVFTIKENSKINEIIAKFNAVMDDYPSSLEK